MSTVCLQCNTGCGMRVKLLNGVAAGAEGGTHSHARRALALGATVAELEHVALLAITTLGFPRAMAGLAWIRDVTEAGGKSDATHQGGAPTA